MNNYLIQKSCLIGCVVAAAWLTVLPSLSIAQEAPDNYAEYDHWRGSSLGIRIERRDGKVYVGQVHEHVADSCPFKWEDRIISIAGIAIEPDRLQRLSELLAGTDPDGQLTAVVEREGNRRRLVIPTYRRELVDVPAIVEQLRSNRIIQSYLEETNRSDYLETVFDRMVAAVEESKSPREAAEGINAIIDEIDVSHTSILPPQSLSQLNGGKSGDLGLTLQRHVIDGQNRYFVTDRMPGSTGYESNIVLGDEMISFNRVPIERSRRLILAGQEHRRGLFFIQVNVGEEVEIEFRRRQNMKPQSLALQGRDAVPAENVIQLSARVIESGKNQYGYIRFWNLMSMQTPTLAKGVIKDQFGNCDMLILDLRGRGGLIPAVLGLDLMVKQTTVPVIAITDDLTRSAKEMLSLLIKKHPHVTVVGQTTAGAVTGATMMSLPSGNGFMYPVMSTDALKRFTDDVVLERVGVAPDVEVDFQLPWCAGNDRLLEAAIETGDQQIQELLDSIL